MLRGMLATAVLLLGALGVYLGLRPPLPDDGALVAMHGAETAATEAAPATLVAVGAASGRTDATRPEGILSALPSEAPLARIVIEARDIDGVPAPGVGVYAAPPRHALNHFGVTDRFGRRELVWRPREWPAVLLVELRGRDGSLTGLRRVEVQRGGTGRLTLVLDPLLLPVPGAPVELGAPTAPGAPELESTLVTLSELDDSEVDPFFFEEDLARGVSEPEPLFDARSVATFVCGRASGLVTISESVSVSSSGAALAPEVELALAWGLVTDQNGLPAPFVRVAVERRDGVVLATARSDPNGEFMLQFPPGDVRLRAGSYERGSTAELALHAGAEFEWRPTVRRHTRLSGMLPDDVGVARVEASLLERRPAGDVLFVSACWALPGLPFAVECPPAPSFDVHVTQAASPLLVHRFEQVVESETWTPTFAPGAELHLIPDDIRATHPAAAELRCFEPDGARGARLALGGERGEGVVVVVASSPFRLEVGTTGAQWSAPIPIDPRPASVVDLGLVSLGASARVLLPARESGAAPTRVSVARATGPFEGLVLPRSAARSEAVTIELPPGLYTVVHDDGAHSELRVGGGEVRLPWRPAHATGR